MIGAIAGDIIGSVYEWDNIKTKAFTLFSTKCFFTDDSILTIALADSILTGASYVDNLKKFYRWYPDTGYGGFFHRWAHSGDSQPYNSWGNGAAMRISPVGFAFDSMEEVLAKAKQYTEVTHQPSRRHQRWTGNGCSDISCPNGQVQGRDQGFRRDRISI